MHNKKIIAKGVVVATALSNLPIDSLASTIEEYKIVNTKEDTKENNIGNSIKKFFAKIVEPIEDSVSKPKEVIKVNPNVRTGTVLEIRLTDSTQFVQDLSGNLGGYETVKVITEGDKKLVKADYDNLRLSGIPKVDLSEASSDSMPSGAFTNATHLTEFKFPQGLTTLEDGQYVSGSGYMGIFYNCSNLTGELKIPDSVTKIGNYAFYGCSGFTGNLAIPDSVSSIGKSAFYGCTGFTGDLVIPNLVTSIGSSAFERCSGFDGNLILSESLISIGSSAFASCKSLCGNLLIPDSVTSIGGYAFQSCIKFTGDLIIPETIKRIESGTFDGCIGFNGNLILPESLTFIGSWAFNNCGNLTGDLTIPNLITDIPYNAFSGCSGFNGVLTLPESLITIGETAFKGCKRLVGNLIIPDSVTDIKKSAFQDCSGFNGYLKLSNSLNILNQYTFSGCNNFTGDLVIPNSITTIGSGVFMNCKNFNGTLKLSENLKTISMQAFYNCSKLIGDIIIPDTVTSIGQIAFSECTKIDKIIVKIDESYINTEYRKSAVENLPIDKTYLEMSYNFDTAGTWLETSDYIKARPNLSTYVGNFENNEGMGVTLEVIEASGLKKMNITKDGLDYDIEKNEDEKYIFNEIGNYNVYIETELGTISNILFKNNSPINTPSINVIDNNLNIINNGILSNIFIEKESEEFDNPDDLKFNFSNSNWTIENGILKSETINHNGETENEFTINAEDGDKIQIRLKTSSENKYDWGYIYLNGSEVYKKSGTSTDFEVLEFDLQEGDNTIKFKYSKDSSGSKGDDSIFIDYIKTVKKEVTAIDCDTLEYRIDGGDWQTYTGSFELNYPAGTKVQVEVRASHDGFTSTILSQEVTVELNIQEIEEAVEKAVQSREPIDISDARDLVNQMPECSKKDEFQDRLDTIFPNITLEKKTASFNSDIYIKMKNVLSLSLDTNSVTFDDVSGTEDTEKKSAINITVNSSLPYDLNAYMPTMISNSDGSSIMDIGVLNIKESSENNYKVFANNTDKILLKENNQGGVTSNHNIDLRLNMNKNYKTDVYKAVIKFEVEQK